MRKKINGHPVMTLAEVQRVFPVSRPTIAKWAREGHLPSIRVGTRTFILRKALMEMIEGRQPAA